MPNGLACLCVALVAVGCDPSPSFPPAEPPLVGVVVLEREVIDAGNVTFRVGQMNVATLSVPLGAVPAGTRLVVRLVRDVRKTAPGGDESALWHVNSRPAALQILPANVTFAMPATLTLPSFLPPNRGALVLAADENAEAWQSRGPAAIVADVGPDPSRPRPGGPASAVAAIDGPHLWSFESRALVDVGTPGSDARAD